MIEELLHQQMTRPERAAAKKLSPMTKKEANALSTHHTPPHTYETSITSNTYAIRKALGGGRVGARDARKRPSEGARRGRELRAGRAIAPASERVYTRKFQVT